MRRSVFARCRTVLFATAAAVALVTPLAAQTDVTTVRINGTVRDADGGGLPGATVEAKNQETGLLKSTTSRTDGSYTILDLPTGRYNVTASLSGFKSGVREGIRIDLGMSPTIDFRLQLTSGEDLRMTLSHVARNGHLDASVWNVMVPDSVRTIEQQ